MVAPAREGSSRFPPLADVRPDSASVRVAVRAATRPRAWAAGTALGRHRPLTRTRPGLS
jgi:hypothetical protein